MKIPRGRRRSPTPPTPSALERQDASRQRLATAVRAWVALRGASSGTYTEVVEGHTREGVAVTMAIAIDVAPTTRR